MATPLDTSRHSNDGFQDFLSKDEEHDMLFTQESVALERRMQTLGLRDGLELGKEEMLQEGFDRGFIQGATRSFYYGRLRGALETARACGLFDSIMMTQAQTCMSQLKSLEMDTTTNKVHNDLVTACEVKAKDLLTSIGIDVSTFSH
ncbi:unnamed protein product [Peronospora belbahrii]|uniref:Essential protein Yae1 N-terminal domain-containing protein n=1 Tax=Peronospora belbahrii TaxID=622444 RepID=A0AAU9L473_9STRA|nr:unnamed protein product [Peronospora belbahrii]CAH0516666.1 unnamed protein product [Peronospora belbahrii]